MFPLWMTPTLAKVNTMANADYGRIMSNIMGELRSPPPTPLGNMFQMTDVVRLPSPPISEWHSFSLACLDVPFIQQHGICQGKKIDLFGAVL